MGQYSEEWWFANGQLAANQRAAVFEEDQNTLASIFSDAGLTVALANPTTTSGAGVLTFYAADGSYWIFVGKVGTGDSVLATIGADPDNPVLSVNGELPDGGGNVTLVAADVGADPAGAAAAAAAASQPLATIDAAGDLYLGTGNNTTTRLPIGSAGEVLTVSGGTASWEPAGGGGGAVDSVNGQVGVVVLDAGDVGADPAGSAAAVQALALLKAQNLADLPNPATARTSLGLGTAAVANTGVGATNVILGNDARLTDARTPTAHASTHEDGGSDEVTLAQSQITGLVTDLSNKQPLDSDLTTIAGLAPSNDDIIQRKAGAWTNRTVAQYKTDLAYTAAQVGADPAGSAAAAQAASQPLDADLTQIAGLTPSNDDVLQRKAGLWVGRSIVQYKADLAYTAAQVGAPALSDLTTKGDLWVATGAGVVTRRGVGSNGQVLTANSANADGVEWANPPSKTLVFYDDRSTLTASAGDARFYNREQALVIVGVWASAGVVPTGADIIVDVHLNGTTIFSTQANRPTVPATTNGGAISATPNTTAFALGDYLTVDIDQIGSTIAGGRLTVGIVVRRA